MDCLPQLDIAAIHAEAGYNSVVPGIGILCENDKLILAAGRFHNSVNTMSNYAVAGTYLGQVGKIHYGVIGGVIDGYSNANNGYIIPMAAGVVTIPMTGYELHTTIVPPVPNYTPAFVQFSISF